jgi:ABC-type glycerol-3-phosphate transport system substrate-binding protein
MKTLATIVVLLVFLSAAVGVFAAGEQEEARGPVTLVVWDFKYGEATGAGPPFRKMDEMFMDRNPDIKIDHVAQPHDEYYNIVRSVMAAKAGPDVLMFHAEQRAYEFADLLVSMDDYLAPIRNQFSDSVLLACTPNRDFADGIKIAPLTTQGLGFYYNKDLFRRAGLDPNKAPKAWADFLAACRQLKSAGTIPIIWGNTPAYYTNWLIRTLSCNFYGTEGHRGFATGASNFTDKEFRTAIEMMYELRKNDYLDPVGADMPLFMEAIDKYKAGKGAFFCGLLSDIAHWKDFCDALGKDKVGYFPNLNHPSAKYKDRQNTMGAGIGWSITSWSNHKDQAAKFVIHYISGDAPLEFVNQTGALVPNNKIDYSTLGYGVLTDILDYLSKNPVEDFVAYVPAAANNDLQSYDQLLFNAKEISVDRYIESVQKSLEANR